MFGQNKIVCIAGKNQCSIDFLIYISSKIPNKNIRILPNKNDSGIDNWQPSLKKFAINNNFRLISLGKLYKIKNLVLISIEYENLINIKKFLSNELYNFHFSLLPKYRGCHTNFYQIFNGEKNSGVTLHKIDGGIDTGPIIDQIKFPIKINSNSYDNYFLLMKYAFKLLKKNFNKIIIKKYKLKNQDLQKGSYYSRSSIDYNKMKIFNVKVLNSRIFNEIKAFIFPPFQLPIVNGKTITSIKVINKKYRLFYD